MPQFLHAKRLTETVTGYHLDIKQWNKEWGKKQRSHKSQIRTLLWVLVYPCLGFMCLGTCILTSLMLCCCRLRKTQGDSAGEKEKAH